mgnify:CR=1 FL=1
MRIRNNSVRVYSGASSVLRFTASLDGYSGGYGYYYGYNYYGHSRYGRYGYSDEAKKYYTDD